MARFMCASGSAISPLPVWIGGRGPARQANPCVPPPTSTSRSRRRRCGIPWTTAAQQTQSASCADRAPRIDRTRTGDQARLKTKKRTPRQKRPGGLSHSLSPKPPLGSFTRSRSSSVTGKPSARNGPVSPGVIERWEGLRRLLPEPTPSPRLWASVRARPRADTINLNLLPSPTSQNRTFLPGSE